jgi:TPR repeat protein
MNTTRLILSALVLGICLSATAPVQAKLKEAEAAFQARDFATTLKELKPYLKKKKQPTRASLILARMYLEGLGVPANYSRAYQHLLRPAKKGNAWAATELGKLYLTGSGVMASNATAETWFKQAADVGYGPAQIELGHLHAKGLSRAINKTMAYAWYNLAASSLMGDARALAMQYRDTLGASMTAEEIAIAQARSLDWADRIKVVEPEIISLIDQATMLAEKKIEQAGEQISKLSDAMDATLNVKLAPNAEKPSSKATPKPADKPQNATQKPEKDAQNPGTITQVSKDGKITITITPQPKVETAEQIAEEDVSFIKSVSSMITSVIVSIFGSTESGNSEPGDPASPAPLKKPVPAKSG